MRKLIFSCKNKNIIIPYKFITTIRQVSHRKGNPFFARQDENDASEFFIFLLDAFHGALSRHMEVSIVGIPVTKTDDLAIQCFKMIETFYSTQYSEIYELFGGIHVSQISSLAVEEILSSKPEVFFTLELPISSCKNPNMNSIQLYDCLREYVQPDLLTGENAWLNEKTGERQDVSKRIVFWKLPQLLVITLKRTSKRVVQFPIENLDMSEFIVGYFPKSYVYDLYAVCDHHGSSNNSGHYTCFVKITTQWVAFNDANIMLVTNPTQMITNSAYTLFYRKRNP